MRVLAFASQKSGAGKTTLAGHMAVQAQRAGAASVALIDTDPDASLADWCALREGLSPRVVRATPKDLATKVEKFRQEGVDFVIVDTAPSMSHALEDALAIVDLVAIPTRPCAHDLAAAGATVALAQRHGKPFVFVVNGATPDGELTSEVVMALAQHGTVASVTIPRNLDFVESMIEGRTVMEMAREASPAPAIVRLWEYLAGKFPKEGSESAAPRSQTASPEPPDSTPPALFSTRAATPKVDTPAVALMETQVAQSSQSTVPSARVPPPPVVAAAEAPAGAPTTSAKPLNPEQMRRFPRFEHERPASLIVSDREVDCTILDISAGGALIRIGTPLAVGAAVTLNMPVVGQLAAEVRHLDADQAGLRFTIDPRRQLKLVRHLSAELAAGATE